MYARNTQIKVKYLVRLSYNCYIYGQILNNPARETSKLEECSLENSRFLVDVICTLKPVRNIKLCTLIEWHSWP